GIIGHWIFPGSCFGRAQFGQHAIEREALGAITPTQAVDLELASLANDLKREQVFPFGPACMQKSQLALGRLQQEKRVVFDWHIPIEGFHASPDPRKVTQKPLRKIDEMNALVQQFAAPGAPRLRAPLAFVTRPAAMAVTAADKHKLAGDAGFPDLARFAQRTVIPMIEAHPHQSACALGCFAYKLEFGRAPRSRFFDEHMFSVRGCAGSDCRQEVVRRGDDHQVDIFGPYSSLPFANRASARNLAGKVLGAPGVGVAAYSHPASCRHSSTLSAHKSAAYDCGSHEQAL